MQSLTLSSTVAGEGKDLVLLHGWGMNSGVFGSMAKSLSKTWRVYRLDLPGYGINLDKACSTSLECQAEAVLAAAPEKAVWVGWSLGGLVAVQAAGMMPDRIRGLVLLSATPRMVVGQGWPCAMPEEEFRGFVTRYETDPGAALQRFDLLQFKGTKKAGEGVRRLRELLGERRANPAALRDGLRLLLNADVRKQMSSCRQRLEVIYGDRDALIPAEYGHVLAEQMPHAEVIRIRGAGHAPFITHEDEVVAAVNRMMVQVDE